MGCRQNVGHSGGCGRAVQSLLPRTPHREMARNLQKSHTSLCHISSEKTTSLSQQPKPLLSRGAPSQTLPLGEALNFPALQVHLDSQPSSPAVLWSITHWEAAILPVLPTLPLLPGALHSCLLALPRQRVRNKVAPAEHDAGCAGMQ